MMNNPAEIVQIVLSLANSAGFLAGLGLLLKIEHRLTALETAIGYVERKK